MYKCGHCGDDVMETHIVCDYARAKSWWCEKQFAKCPHRERWYPKPWFPGCADCIEKKEEQRRNKRRSRATLSGFNSGDAGGSGGNGGNDDELDDEMGWCSGFGAAGEENKELILALLPHLGQSLRERSDSVRTTRTTWSGVQMAARAGEPAPRLWPAEDALKDAQTGVPKPRRKRWYKPSL